MKRIPFLESQRIRRATELYRELSELFVDQGIASHNFSKLSELFSLARIMPPAMENYYKVARRCKTSRQFADETGVSITFASSIMKRFCDYGLLYRKKEISDLGMEYVYDIKPWKEAGR